MVAHAVVSREMPVALSRYFAESYFSLLLLPSCHSEYNNGWLTEIQDLMISHRSLYFSVLACAASHVHLIDNSTPAQGLSIAYYTKATRELSVFLKTATKPENHNGLLMSIMLLYLHGVRYCSPSCTQPMTSTNHAELTSALAWELTPTFQCT